MIKNNLKAKLLAKIPAFCGWLHIPNSWTAEINAQAGWDGLSIDLQHGMHNIETAMHMMQAISISKTTPLARVNWNQPGQIMKLLDGGAFGIICPMINTAEECQSFVNACYYPPKGSRSLGPTRVLSYAGPDYVKYANNEILSLAMIETVEAVKNLDEILSVESLDGIFIGSGDLSMSIDASKNKVDLDSVINSILEKCKHYNKIPGIWCNSLKMAHAMKNKGFLFIAVLSDSMLLENHTKELVSALKSID